MLSDRARVGLAMFAVGVLAFLFVDVFEHAFEHRRGAVEGFEDGEGSFGNGARLTSLLLGGGFAAGSAGLAMLERRMRPDPPLRAPMAGGSADAMTVEQADAPRRPTTATRSARCGSG